MLYGAIRNQSPPLAQPSPLSGRLLNGIVKRQQWRSNSGARHREVVQFPKGVRAAEKMCLSISRLSRKPASTASMRGRLSNTRKSRTKEKHRQTISSFNADLAESNR
jgi:hypothetical protein